MESFAGVRVAKRANVYFEGRCVSHTVWLADGSRKSVGVILPSKLRFATGEREVMEILEGRGRVLLPGESAWRDIEAGSLFVVPAESAFEIEASEPLHYVCHFGDGDAATA